MTVFLSRKNSVIEDFPNHTRIRLAQKQQENSQNIYGKVYIYLFISNHVARAICHINA
jgi:hypothetical protein